MFTLRSLLNRLQALEDQGVDLDSYDVSVLVDDEFFTIDGFGIIEGTDVLDAGHPVLVVGCFPVENIKAIEV